MRSKVGLHSSSVALVTGASGFAGSSLCRELVKRGYTVRGLVRPSSNLRLLEGENIELAFCDLAQGIIKDDIMEGVDIVYHIAASYRKENLPDEYFFAVNAEGTESLLKAAVKAGVSRFVHCSTVGVLGNIKNPPASEDTPYNPGDVYQRSKMEGEIRALSYFKENKLSGVVVRPAAIYGPGDTRFLKLFRTISNGWFPMIGKGENYYHLVYIDDLIEGIILAGQYNGPNGEIFIIAGEQPIQVKDLIGQIAIVLDSSMPKWNIPVEPVMLFAKLTQAISRPIGIEPPIYPRRLDFFIKTRAFDITKARERLGYSPQVDLISGLTRTAEWYRNNHLLA